VIILVGYFILGPTDLYKLVKEIGKTIQNVRTLGVEASKSFENTMEDQLDLQELRKAQQELNDAFSFRRSINVEEDSLFKEGSPEAMAEEAAAAEAAAVAAAAASAGTAAAATASATATDAPPKKKKMKRRRMKKKVEPAPEEFPPVTNSNVPDLDMPEDAFKPIKPEPAAAPVAPAPSPVPVSEAGSADWFEEQAAIPEQFGGSYDEAGTGESAYEQDRFAAQLTGNWNQQILDNEDKLSPLSKVMERLAILEEEKRAADMRLEEEFRLKAELEEKFYDQKRKLLEDAVAEVQADAYASMAESASNKTEAKSTTV